MAPNSPSATSTSTAAVSSPSTSSPTANLTPPTPFADQSKSRLMALPKELRNRIYEFVFCDNSTYSLELIAFHWNAVDYSHYSLLPTDMDFTTERKLLPHRRRLENADPPSKDSILPCRELHAEMRHMYIAAYRTYWTTNRFTVGDTEDPRASSARPLPADENITQIREFLLILYYKWYIRLTLDNDELNWIPTLLEFDDGLPANHDRVAWFYAQRNIEHVVGRYLNMRHVACPGAGPGLTKDMLADVPRLGGIGESIAMIQEHRRISAGRLDRGTAE